MNGLFLTIAFFISLAITGYLTRPNSTFIMDEPNARSLHSHPIPATGGIAILSSFFIILFAKFFFFSNVIEHDLIWISLAVFLIAIVSLMDDWKEVPILYRLSTHLIAALLLLWQTNWVINALFFTTESTILVTVINFTITLFTIIWLINLYNFMDGMDGFAAGMAVIGFTTFALLGWQAQHITFSFISLLIAMSSLGFLIFNFPPARIFMGDIGSSSLGFLVAALSLWANQSDIFPIWIAFLIFSPFIIDATVTLLRRLLQGEKIWQAHKTHYYQRLVELGWGHRRTTLWEYGLMLSCSLSALIMPQLDNYIHWIILGIWFIIYVILIYLVNWLEHRQHTIVVGTKV